MGRYSQRDCAEITAPFVCSASTDVANLQRIQNRQALPSTPGVDALSRYPPYHGFRYEMEKGKGQGLT